MAMSLPKLSYVIMQSFDISLSDFVTVFNQSIYGISRLSNVEPDIAVVSCICDEIKISTSDWPPLSGIRVLLQLPRLNRKEARNK